jgi:hypothetical protein
MWHNLPTDSSTTDLVTTAGSHLIKNNRWPSVRCELAGLPQNDEINWEKAISSLPDFSRNFLHKLLSTRNMRQTLRSVSRLLAVTLPADILGMFGMNENFISQKKKETPPDKTLTFNSHFNEAFMKLSFLMICKVSSVEFPPQSRKMNTFRISDVTFLMTKYSNAAMHTVYGSMLLPLLSTKHTVLIFRLFEHAHQRFNPAHVHIKSKQNWFLRTETKI